MMAIFMWMIIAICLGGSMGSEELLEPMEYEDQLVALDLATGTRLPLCPFHPMCFSSSMINRPRLERLWQSGDRRPAKKSRFGSSVRLTK